MSLLETARLYLEEASLRHIDLWYEAMLDGYEDGQRWLSWGDVIPGRDAVLEEMSRWQEEERLIGKSRFFIFKKEDDRLIGLIGFGRRDEPDEAYVFYYIRASQRKKGYMKEMVKEFIKWSHSHWNIPCVVVKSEVGNIASTQIVRGL